MKKSIKLLLAAALAASATTGALAAEGKVPRGVARLDHVFLVMMENHGYGEVMGNSNMPFFNRFARDGASANNYFAVAHPSLTNYLEIVGGSNFGVLNDHSPDWHSPTCTTNLATGVPSLDTGAYPAICPIAVAGTDAATPAVDTSGLENNPGQSGPVINIDGTAGFPAATNTTPKTLAHQLVAAGRSWKAYEESLPPTGADNVNSADGLFSNLNPPSATTTEDNYGLLALYAVKHDPFVYFKDVQTGTDPRLSLSRVVGFDGDKGLFADLATGHLPDLVYIVPNQCNDQHGRNGAGPACDYDANDVGVVAGLNPALMYQGDVALERIVRAIKASPAWNAGRNAIVIVWDESDYAQTPITNQVAMAVQLSDGSNEGVQSKAFYTHFSLLKSIEAGFGLPCLNHACDNTTQVMSDVFGGR